MRKVLSLLIVALLAVYCPKATAQGSQVKAPAISQTLGKIVAASPEASSIALYQNYPVDNVSGTPNIEIPLFEVPTRAGTLPLKLSYHIGKLKPSEGTNGPGWGWTLTPNLGVTRSVKGGFDGVSTGYKMNSTMFSNTTGNFDESTYLYPASQNTIDEQPDDFYYSLLSKGGGFVYNESGGFTTIPYDAVKITHTDDRNFVITDDDGTIYKFGNTAGTTDALEFPNISSPASCWKITEIIPYDKSDTIRFIYGTRSTFTIPFYNIFYKIIEYPEHPGAPAKVMRSRYNFQAHKTVSAAAYNISQGMEILRPHSMSMGNFSDLYTGDFDFPLPPNNADYKADISSLDSAGLNAVAWAWNTINYTTSYSDPVSTFSENKSDQLPLTEIRFKGGKVLLTYDGRRLKSVQLYGPNNVLVKKAMLYQHNLTFDAEQPVAAYDAANTRHGLDSVIISGSDTLNTQVYRMLYTRGGIYGTAESIGVYGGYNSDYWGFWGYNKGANTVPRMMYKIDNYRWNGSLETGLTGGGNVNTSAWVQIGSIQEKTSPDPIVPGIIRRIQYPTGGYAAFDFEMNRYYSAANSSRVVYGGGYRVKQIRYATGDNRDSIIKVYKYGENENGIGKIKYAPNDLNFISQQWVNSTTSGQAGDTLQKITTFNAKPVLDLAFSNGAAVLYTKVTEYIVSSAQNDSLGKTVYAYNINYRGDNFRINTPLHADARDDWKTITPVSQWVYRYKNNAYSVVSKTAYQYQDYMTDTIKAGQSYCRYTNNIPDAVGGYIYGSHSSVLSKFERLPYFIYTGAHKLKQQRDTIYNPDNTAEYVATTTIYDYSNINLYPSRITTTDSKGDTSKSDFFYPFQAGQITDLISGQATLLSGLQTANRINAPVEVKEYEAGTLLRTVQQNYTQYTGSRIFPSATYASLLSNTLEKKMDITMYDIYGNIVEQRKADDTREVYLWGYRSQYPVAKVIGSDYNTVKSFISQALLDSAQNYTDAQVRTELNKIRTGLDATAAQVFTYTYKPMVGVTSETDARGRLTSYEYDSYGRLRLVKNNEGHIVKMICYNYAGQPENCEPKVYYNTELYQLYYRSDCGPGYTGSAVYYYVPANKYSSLVSQSIADQLAYDDADTYGPAYANANGTCTSTSLSISYNNFSSSYSSPITFTFTNTSTSAVYTLSTAAFSSSGTLSGGTIPEGTYNVQISNPNAGSFTYQVACYYSISGSSPLTLYSVSVGQSCPMVTIQ